MKIQAYHSNKLAKQFKMKLSASCTLGASLLGNILAGRGINRAREGILRAGYGNKRQDYVNIKDF